MKTPKNWSLLMPEDANTNCDRTVADTIERVRSQRFPDVDRDLVLEILRLHAEGAAQENVGRLVDEAIAKRTTATV